MLLTTQAAQAADGARADALAEVADLVVCGAETLDAHRMVAALAGRGHRVLHCEGGPTLFGALAAAGLVDELDLSLSPLLAGGPGPRILTDPGSEVEPSALRLASLLEEDGMLFLRHVRADREEAS